MSKINFMLSGVEYVKSLYNLETWLEVFVLILPHFPVMEVRIICNRTEQIYSGSLVAARNKLSRGGSGISGKGICIKVWGFVC